MERPLLQNTRQIESALQRTKRVSRAAQVAFTVVLAGNLLAAALLFGSSVIAAFAPSLLPGVVPFGPDIVPQLLAVAISCAILYALIRAFADMAKGFSPFTAAQSKRLFGIGCLLLVGVATDMIASGCTGLAIAIEGVNLGYKMPAEPGLIYLNGSYLTGAVISFCLSFVFKYGALLQRLSDDTV